MLMPRDAAWLKSWSGPDATLIETLAWLNSTPFGKSVEGPESEVASNQGAKGVEARWHLGHYKRGPHCGMEEVRNPKSPDGYFSSAELFERWKETGMGWRVVRPSVTTREFHFLLTGQEPGWASPAPVRRDGSFKGTTEPTSPPPRAPQPSLPGK
jgi:hypothetical protein